MTNTFNNLFSLKEIVALIVGKAGTIDTNLINDSGIDGIRTNVASLRVKSLCDDFNASFYDQYRAQGGKALPAEIVDMALRQVQSPVVVLVGNKSVKRAIYDDVLTQLAAQGVSDTRDRHRLATIFIHQEFNFSVKGLISISERLFG